MAYHYSEKTGKIGICRASIRSCPIGGEEQHFETQSKAITYAMDNDPEVQEAKKELLVGVQKQVKLVERNAKLSAIELEPKQRINSLSGVLERNNRYDWRHPFAKMMRSRLTEDATANSSRLNNAKQAFRNAIKDLGVKSSTNIAYSEDLVTHEASVKVEARHTREARNARYRSYAGAFFGGMGSSNSLHYQLGSAAGGPAAGIASMLIFAPPGGVSKGF